MHGDELTTYISGWQIIDWLDSVNALSGSSERRRVA
jgi:hypothetical protein